MNLNELIDKLTVLRDAAPENGALPVVAGFDGNGFASEAKSVGVEPVDFGNYNVNPITRRAVYFSQFE